MRAKEDEKNAVPRETLVFFVFKSKTRGTPSEDLKITSMFHVEQIHRFLNYNPESGLNYIRRCF
jgi:hypothetical protein